MTTREHTGEPLYRQVGDKIRERIQSGELRPGMQLPSEPDLAHELGIARMTARRAIDDLVQEGLLIRHRGRGTFVAEPRLTYPPASLFSFTTTMESLGYIVKTRLLALEVVPARAQVARDLNVAEGDPVLLVRRLRFVDDEPVALHDSFMDRRYLDGLLASDLLTRPISEAVAKVTGERMTSSRDFLEAAAATKEEASLLRIAPGDPVQLVLGVACTDAGRPTLATRAVYRADRFRFTVAAREGEVPFEIKQLPTGASAVPPDADWRPVVVDHDAFDLVDGHPLRRASDTLDGHPMRRATDRSDASTSNPGSS